MILIIISKYTQSTQYPHTIQIYRLYIIYIRRRGTHWVNPIDSEQRKIRIRESGINFFSLFSLVLSLLSLLRVKEYKMTGKQLEEAYKERKGCFGKVYIGKARTMYHKTKDIFLDLRTGAIWINTKDGIEKLYNPKYGIHGKIDPNYVAHCLALENYSALAKIVRDYCREAY